MNSDVKRYPTDGPWLPTKFILYPTEEAPEFQEQLADITTTISVTDALLSRLVIGD